MIRINPVTVFRKIRSSFLRKKLLSHDLTIISNNCTAGIIYNIFGIRFLSPTINLQINDDDFPFFLNHFDNFLESDLTRVESSGYPIGALSFDEKTIDIHFMHYHSFEEAKLKWEERKKRINKSNLCVIWMINHNITNKKINDFLNIKFKKKMLITYKDIHVNGSLSLNIFNKENYKNGEVFWYKHWFSLRRNIESIDLLSFLNNGECKYAKRH